MKMVMGDYIHTDAKPMPVILLLDTSGSMTIDDNIGTLNRCVKEMLRSFKNAENDQVEIHMAVITFGETTGVYLPLQDVNEIDESRFELKAYGQTPMGQAISIAKQMIEDKNQVPSRAYRPTVVMVTDGRPGDNWKAALESFVKEGRSSKCYRMALGIGAGSSGDAYEVLKAFVSSDEFLFKAADAGEISRFFNFVTMSTTGRTTSANPNIIEPAASRKPEANDSNGDTDSLFDDLLGY